MTISILFFGKLADEAQNLMGQAQLDYPYTTATSSIATLCNTLIETYPGLQAELQNKANLYAVNQTQCHIDQALHDGDEVALMSPFSGG